MKRKLEPDKNKAESLKNMAEITLERLDKTDKANYPSNTLIDYYDIMHKILEAISLMEGTKVKGEGAHQELIDYICKKYKIEEQKRQFLQQLRDYRNMISYEGFSVNKEYIVNNQEFIKNLIDRLFEILNIELDKEVENDQEEN